MYGPNTVRAQQKQRLVSPIHL